MSGAVVPMNRIELSMQSIQASLETRTGCCQRHALFFGDLDCTEVLEVSKQDRFAVRLGKREDAFNDQTVKLGALDDIRGCPRHALGPGHRDLTPTLAQSGAAILARPVAHDGPQPGPEGPGPLRRARDHLDQGLLHDVIRRAFVQDEAAGEGGHPPCMLQ